MTVANKYIPFLVSYRQGKKFRSHVYIKFHLAKCKNTVCVWAEHGTGFIWDRVKPNVSKHWIYLVYISVTRFYENSAYRSPTISG